MNIIKNITRGNMKRGEVVFVMILVLTFFIINITGIRALNSGSSANATLSIWTNGTPSGQNLTYGSLFEKDSLRWGWYFLANFTNSSNSIINSTTGNGICSIRFNYTSINYTNFANMTYNPGSKLWQYSSNFTYKGNLSFQVNCTSSYGSITNLTEIFFIFNTPPSKILDQVVVDYYEDNITTESLNSSSYFREDDKNDILTYTFINISSNKFNETSSLFYNWIFLNSSTGFVTHNVTNDTLADIYTLNILLTDSGNNNANGQVISKDFTLNISAVNDPPYFYNMTNLTINKSMFSRMFLAYDEENNYPFGFNVSFINCIHTGLNPPTGPGNCTIFNVTTNYNNTALNITNGTAINITFEPTNPIKGYYTLEFSLNDSLGAESKKTVYWNLSWNEIPYFNFVCDNNRNATEDIPFSCYINATDSDETTNLTFSANYTWFTFNGTTLSNTINLTGISENFSALVNFTATDSMVGNWFVNISINDKFKGHNSTIINFNISNVNDAVNITTESFSVSAFTSNTYEILINVSDDDLLIPDKNVFNESLNFSTNVSWVNFSAYQTNGSIVISKVIINASTAIAGQNYSVRLNVTDITGNQAFKDIYINVSGNNLPSYVSNMTFNYNLIEGSTFYLNLTMNVTDLDINDLMNFSFTNLSYFADFNISQIGIINFIPKDEDVGFYSVLINVSDSKSVVTRQFNFTVNNTPDTPYISRSLSGLNLSIDSSSNIVTQEENNTVLYLYIFDDDFKISDNQKSFYNESLNVNFTLYGRNPNLVNFSYLGVYPPGNQTIYRSIFKPNSSDIGYYNGSLIVRDAFNLTDTLYFNFSVISTYHVPVLNYPGNIIVSYFENISIDINATDFEDVMDDYIGSNITFYLNNLTARGDFLTINSITGLINFSFNRTYVGAWTYNLSVKDSSGLFNNTNFTLFVYDEPVFLNPDTNVVYNFKENVSSLINISTNHSVGNMLNYTLTINGNFKNSSQGTSNGNYFGWYYTPNFTEETTCIGTVNLTINISNPKFSAIRTWNVTINHTNFPLRFVENIGGSSGVISSASPYSLSLSSYFLDYDAMDRCINQSIGFGANLLAFYGYAQNYTIINWTNGTSPVMTFSASGEGMSNYTLFGYEYNESNLTQVLVQAVSNNFSINISNNVIVITVPQPSLGGGGGSSTSQNQGNSSNKPYSLKLLLPGAISSKNKDKIFIPLGVENTGKNAFYDINFAALLGKDGVANYGASFSFEPNEVDYLGVGERKNVSLIAIFDMNDTGLYDITINATATNPYYTDWGKIQIMINDRGSSFEEKIVFTQEFISDNPECLEVKELVDKARESYSRKDYDLAEKQVQDALDACKQFISQKRAFAAFRDKIGSNIFTPVIIVSMIMLFVGLFIYYIRRLKFRLKSN